VRGDEREAILIGSAFSPRVEFYTRRFFGAGGLAVNIVK
jgi:hypothetical protein